MSVLRISPSVLSADFSKLGEEIISIEKAGADYIHFDVMDGHFVPNITIGPLIISSVKKITHLPFDVHLMINNPEKYIDTFADAGADIITVHSESVIHLDRCISKIKARGIKAGVALVPSTHSNVLEYVMDKVDLILVMTVNPGFGGQSFLHSQLPKIKNIRKMIQESGREIDLEVDGGVDNITALKVREAGANVLVSGSYIFSSADYKQRILSLKEAINNH